MKSEKRPVIPQRPRLFVLLLLLATAAFSARAQNVFISEFLASNSGGLRDEDNDSSDWIEIFNASTGTVNLDGWFLTDAASNLTKWRFPATNIPPNGFVLVFASSKNRAVAGAPLHANFNLSAGGEYLALVRPDGTTIAHEFAPAFPAQFQNISYGVGQNLSVTRLISNTSPARILIPTNGNLGASWTAHSFDDATWPVATNGVGYETYVAGFAVRNILASGGVCTLDAALAVLVTPAQQGAVFTESRDVINYVNTEAGAHFGNDFTFPALTIGSDANNFVLEATGILTIPTSGEWTFGVNSDDGFQVDIGPHQFSYPPPRGPGDTVATFNLAAGDYPVRLVFYECNGGAEVEFFAAAGAHGGFNSSFRLVGDPLLGIGVKSLPTGSGGSLRPFIATDVQSQMHTRASSAYVRLPMNVPNPGAFSTLTLRMKYDDGFVAYLNGTEVARRNTPATPQWNSVAPANRPVSNAVVFEDIDLTSRLNLLQAGGNTLAIHALNDAAGSTDFLVLAELVENKILGLTNHYFSVPSPQAVNGEGTFAFVENLTFTPGRGWFDSTNFNITITSPTPGVTIRYTTNGSAPSPTNGIVYTGPIPANGTRLIRAVGYGAGFEPTRVETHSYIFLNQVQAQTEDGSVGGSSGNYTLNPAITQSPEYGPAFKSDLLSVPTLSIVLAWEDVFGPSGFWSNPQAEGVAWERPCSLEYMRPDGEEGFEINCGIRIQGGASRNLVPKHGVRVLFKNIYGKGKLEYPLYPDSPVQEFDTLTIHATFNDHWLWGGAQAQMQRDQWLRDSQNAMGGYGPHGTYVHLYLNGLYWGLYNIGEKGDASYAAHYLGGEKEEYDAFNSDELIDGNATAWNTMHGIASAGITSDAAYTNLSQYLNIPNFANYMLMNFYAATTDWPWHNWNAARRRVPGAGFHFFSWDAEWSFGIGGDVNSDRTGIGAGDGSPGRLYAALRGHHEFRVLFGDLAQKHLFNGGALTPAATESRWMTRAMEIDRAIVPESARWGNGYTRATWLSAQSAVRSWFPQRGAILLNQLRNAGLYPQLGAPQFSPFGGLVPPGFPLTLSNQNASGSIYYTLNGTDPRRWGGSVTPGAQLYAGPLVLTNAAFVRARVRDGTNWSALVEAPFYVAQDFDALAVTEIMYRPLAFGTNSGDDLEFLELKNTGSTALDLSGLQFTEGITFSFTNGARLAPGAFFVLARNTAAFGSRYPGVTVNGVYEGRLNNAGEQLTLAHLVGTNVFSFAYNNATPWPITPDGYGFSLVPIGDAGNPGSASSWRASATLGGSPGADDPVPALAPIVINEILTHTDPPLLDTIELHNPTASSVDVGGWYLSDDAATPKKFRIPNGTTIPAGGFLVIDETSFNPQPGIPPSFGLSSHGESLFLFSGDASTNLTGYSHSFDYTAAANGVSFGRYRISTGEENWPALTARTLGAANAAPRIGPLIINEISYHPPLDFDEFVEIHNPGGSPVTLHDTAFPTNAWKLSGLNYTFSNNVVVPADGYLLVVPITPAAFRAKYNVPAAVPIVGPYAARLQDSGERLRLERPDNPDTNGVPYIVVDEVRYNDKLPWPIAADGDGPSLQRRRAIDYGNEPTNWFASGITPGQANVFNQPPSVTLLTPTNNATFEVPAAIVFTAAASDDGTIVRVEYYEGDIKLGEATNAPYTFVWSNAAVGVHTIVAKARDNGLAVTASDPATITVTPPPLGNGIGLRGDYFDNADFTGTRVRRVDPTISFDWGTGTPDPAIAVDSFSVRWTGQVQPRFGETYTFYTVTDDGVRLWVNNQLVIDRWVDQSPTEATGFISLQAGQLYDIRMEYYENGGGAVASLAWSSPNTPREIIPGTQLYPPASSNLPPVVSITSPAAGTVSVATAPVTIVANATDPDGAIFRVEFFANGTKLGEDTTPNPFSFIWPNPAAGTYNLTAVATDDSALVRTSAPVNITVVAGFASNQTLISAQSSWRYLDTGVNQGDAWTAIGFNDAGWATGFAELGYGDAGEGRPEATVVNYGPNAGAKYITTYFRKSFTVNDPASFSELTLRVMRDDGVVVYLNGTEVFRNNLPGGAIAFGTLAVAGLGGADEYTFLSSAVNPGYLLPGENVVAVEMHQNSGGSTDLSFDLELTGVQSYIAPFFTAQPQSRTNGVSTDATFSALVAGSAPLAYQWRFGGVNIPGATNSTFTRFNVQPNHAGNYTLVATNLAGAATSLVATLTVTNPDTDGDGLPNWWEAIYGLNENGNDAALDADGDGMTNLAEFRAGTNPLNAQSVLRLQWISLAPPRLQFVAQSNIAYAIEYATNLAPSPWFTLSNVAPLSQVRTAIVTDPNPTNGTRFYRAVTP